jgi:hypothetical protein
VVNPRQAPALLEAVRSQQPSGSRLVAFFAIMYYAGPRPEEAINLARDNVILPPQVWDEESQQWRDPADDEDWGQLHIRSATTDTGSEWTDDGSPREKRQLKHRAEGDRSQSPGIFAQGLNCGFREWGGWGSNPRPADYESPTVRRG